MVDGHLGRLDRIDCRGELKSRPTKLLQNKKIEEQWAPQLSSLESDEEEGNEDRGGGGVGSRY